ncbi:NrpR regulatory domain-containing protein [candidate division NPL-UPA2 bacterium]|nr:NrpR regulatory domain-containing protein [candidate division NPL-UPA2 bacterium]
MIGYDSHQVERKLISILKVLSESPQPLGARLIARQLKEQGVELGERAVRYHLKLMDERGLTQPAERWDGREITPLGREELSNALVADKIGFVLEKIELLAFRTSFDIKAGSGLVPVNISFFPKQRFTEAVQAMKPAFKVGLCVSNLVAVAEEGERLGEVLVPRGKVGLATVCSIIINGCLLKAGVPMDSRFGGVLQIRNNRPLRFVNLIYYSGSTLDPSEVFIRAKMTNVQGVVRKGEGKVLANFREIPAQCQPLVERVTNQLREVGLDGLIMMGNTSEAVCDIPVGLNRVGMILLGGLTPVAAAEEAGIEAENRAMSTLVEYQSLIKFEEI